MTTHILLVDDEKEIADLLSVYLINEDYTVHTYYSSREALATLDKVKYDLAVLDVMMPPPDGFTMLKIIRENYTFPVIMLTAKVEDMDKIKGLSIGADDYITKPFNPLEVVARIKAQLRRSTKYNENNRDENLIELRGLSIDKETHKATLYGQELSLRPIEFSILWLLCENRGKVLSSEVIFETVWGEKCYDSNNTVMVHIRRIREKMQEPPRNPRFIKTVWGVGYQIEK